MTSGARHATYPDRLENRHLRMWRQLVIGGSHQEIATRTGLSRHTVKNVLYDLYGVLGLTRTGPPDHGARTLATLWGMEIMQQHPEVFRDVA